MRMFLVSLVPIGDGFPIQLSNALVLHVYTLVKRKSVFKNLFWEAALTAARKIHANGKLNELDARTAPSRGANVLTKLACAAVD